MNASEAVQHLGWVGAAALLVLAGCSTSPASGCANDAACGSSQICLQSRCLPTSCGSQPCHKGQGCVQGVCVDSACVSVTCSSGQTCVKGKCYPRDCASEQCQPGEVCWQEDACRTSLCEGVVCSSGFTCADGRCLVASCSGVRCGDGAACEDGACQDARCIGVVCGAGTICADGRCVPQNCPTANCPTGFGCVAGKCVDARCVGVTCPAETQCRAAGCADQAPDAGTIAPTVPDGETCTSDTQCISGSCTTYYVDADGDTFTPDFSTYVQWCGTAAVAGYVASASLGSASQADCYDLNPDARPGQTQCFTADRGDGSFDYDCSGQADPCVPCLAPTGTLQATGMTRKVCMGSTCADSTAATYDWYSTAGLGGQVACGATGCNDIQTTAHSWNCSWFSCPSGSTSVDSFRCMAPCRSGCR